MDRYIHRVAILTLMMCTVMCLEPVSYANDNYYYEHSISVVKNNDMIPDSNGVLIDENYFSDFSVDGPDMDAKFFQAKWEKMYPSVRSCTHSLKKGTGDFFKCELVKMRIAQAAKADTCVGMKVEVGLQSTQLVIDKQYRPEFELVQNGVKTRIKINGLIEYIPNGFVVASGNETIFNSCFADNSQLYMVLQAMDGGDVRIPIDKKVVDCWKEVVNCDLRKLKREYEKLYSDSLTTKYDKYLVMPYDKVTDRLFEYFLEKPSY